MASRGKDQYLGWQGQGGKVKRKLSPTSWTRAEGARMARAVGMAAFPSPREAGPEQREQPREEAALKQRTAGPWAGLKAGLPDSGQTAGEGIGHSWVWMEAGGPPSTAATTNTGHSLHHSTHFAHIHPFNSLNNPKR